MKLRTFQSEQAYSSTEAKTAELSKSALLPHLMPNQRFGLAKQKLVFTVEVETSVVFHSGGGHPWSTPYTLRLSETGTGQDSENFGILIFYLC